jgi:hypothetical protein
VFQRDEFGLPTFWTLQIAGWSVFSALVLLCLFPYLHHPGELRANLVSTLSMFVMSLALWPVCRALNRRHYSWIEQEAWAFLYCLPFGALSAFPCQLVILDVHRWDWAEWLVTSVQSAVVLFLWCSLYFSIKQWQRSARERDRLLRAETEAREARLSALRYQLNPHFLFNSLNAVSTLILDGDAQAATRMLAQIGDLLRSSLDNEVLPEIPLLQEVDFTQRYLAIEQTRLGPRLRIDIAIAPETLDALVPSMLLQPLVENAVRHGIAPLLRGGSIEIRSERAGEHLRICVRNSGASGGGSAHGGLPSNGIGLRNTGERLRTHYGANHRFDLQWPETGGCEVNIELPFQAAREAESPEVALCAR